MKNEKNLVTTTEQNIISDERGASFIEKLIIIGLFALVVAAGINFVGGKANEKLNAQGESVGKVNNDLGGSGI